MNARFQTMLLEHRLEIGQRVVDARKSKGWSQERLAHEARVSTKTISRIENGEHENRGKTMEQVAKALQVKLGDLLAPPASIQELSQLQRIESKLDELLRRLAADADPQAEAPRVGQLPAPPQSPQGSRQTVGVDVTIDADTGKVLWETGG